MSYWLATKVWFNQAEVVRLRVSVSDDFATAGSSSRRSLYIKQVRNRDSRTRDAETVSKLVREYRKVRSHSRRSTELSCVALCLKCWCWVMVLCQSV